jgi:hypothetical protein
MIPIPDVSIALDEYKSFYRMWTRFQLESLIS